MMKEKRHRLLIVILGALSFIGCATAPKEAGLLVWPLPPEEPRIAYLRSYRGEADFYEKGFFDVIFGAPPQPRLRRPFGVFARDGKIYVSLSQGASVVVIDTKRKKLEYIGEFGTGRLGVPLGLAVAADGTLFVADAKTRKVFGYDAMGKLKVAIGKEGEFQNPAGVAINNELGRLYVVDSKAHMVRVYSLKGESLFQFGKLGERDGEFNHPNHIAIDRRNGNVCVTDTINFRVQVFDKDGKFIRKFGEVGDRPGNFARPKGIGIDSEGHIYVADADFNNFQIFDENGQMLLFVGQGGDVPGAFYLPNGMYVDEEDRIYVVDSLNGRIQVFQYLSEPWKKGHPEEYKKYLLPEQK